MDKIEMISKLEKEYLPLDKSVVYRTQNIKNIPPIEHRRGGKLAYSEWAHVIGLFQTLIFTHVQRPESNIVLDVGCGTGLLGIACEPYVKNGGRYIGLDVSADDIDFCKSHYTMDHYEFIHLDAQNKFYNATSGLTDCKWPIEDNFVDLVTALSVWTHFNESDARRYMAEVERVLKDGSYAIITCFHKDDLYEATLHSRKNAVSEFHGTNQMNWVFNTPAYDSSDWFCTEQATIPEQAIAISTQGLESLFSGLRLSLEKIHVGNWKETPGLFFQDIMIIKKN